MQCVYVKDMQYNMLNAHCKLLELIWYEFSLGFMR